MVDGDSDKLFGILVLVLSVRKNITVNYSSHVTHILLRLVDVVWYNSELGKL
jgi:hypothetical protein